MGCGKKRSGGTSAKQTPGGHTCPCSELEDGEGATSTPPRAAVPWPAGHADLGSCFVPCRENPRLRKALPHPPCRGAWLPPRGREALPRLPRTGAGLHLGSSPTTSARMTWGKTRRPSCVVAWRGQKPHASCLHGPAAPCATTAHRCISPVCRGDVSSVAAEQEPPGAGLAPSWHPHTCAAEECAQDVLAGDGGCARPARCLLDCCCWGVHRDSGQVRGRQEHRE